MTHFQRVPLPEVMWPHFGAHQLTCIYSLWQLPAVIQSWFKPFLLEISIFFQFLTKPWPIENNRFTSPPPHLLNKHHKDCKIRSVTWWFALRPSQLTTVIMRVKYDRKLRTICIAQKCQTWIPCSCKSLGGSPSRSFQKLFLNYNV